MKRPSFLSLQLAAISALILPVAAYPYDSSLTDTPDTGQLDGTDSRDTGVVVTYNIPVTNWPDKIDFRAIGGDGGRGRATSSVLSTRNGDGGGGAQIIATFYIDPDDADALRPGGELRMIVGNRGSNETRDGAAGGGGGGSTAVLYRAPVDGADWERLIVSGGGGGGIASTAAVQGFAIDGKNAETGTSGSGGGGASDGGTNGGAGDSVGGAGGGGGINNGGAGGEGGGKASVNGAAGGNATGGSGGFGYSGGGSGASSNDNPQGGGGGGYSGGGGGNTEKQGGGGGSYLDSRAVPASSITARDGNASPGEIAFTATKNTANGNLQGPITTLVGESPVRLLVGESYSEQGITATDLYGNDITLGGSNYIVSDNVNTSTAGTYLVVYTVTDQFGNSSGQTRTVIVEDETPPSFDIIGDVSRLAGSRSIPSFATNFDANDTGQSFSQYTVSNDNNALFSVQPACDASGKLTFIVPNGTYGSANCTITGYDTGDTYNSSSQNFVITITQNPAVADFTVDRTISVQGTAINFTDASSNADSWEWDFDNNGTVDSTEQNPVHTFTTSGSKTVKLTVTNTVGSNSETKTALVNVAPLGFVNGDFSSTSFANGSGDQDSLGAGWYGKNGDDGSVGSPDWSAGETTGTPGVLTQVSSSGSASRFGQFLGIDLDGSNWALSMDLGGTHSFAQVWIYAGVLATNPSGTVLRGDDQSPWTGLVDENGWTSVLYQGGVNHDGTVTLNIDADLSAFNVMAIQFTSSGAHVGTTFDNFQFVQQSGPVAGDDEFETRSDDTVSGNVLDNDTDAYNDTVTVSEVEGEPGDVGVEVTLASGALVTVGSDGSFSYDPAGLFDHLAAGETAEDSFTYTASDGTHSSTATVTVTVRGPGFSDWADDNGYGVAFEADDDGNGQANGFDYIFDDEIPLAMSGVGTMNAPDSVPADVVLHLQTTTDMVTWTTILTYADGSISYQDPAVSIADGVITHGTEATAAFYRYEADLAK